MGYRLLKTKTLVLENGHLWNKMMVGFSHLAYVGVRELVSDSGYGHEDISCIDIHVGILLECVFFFFRSLHVHLGGE